MNDLSYFRTYTNTASVVGIFVRASIYHCHGKCRKTDLVLLPRPQHELRVHMVGQVQRALVNLMACLKPARRSALIFAAYHRPDGVFEAIVEWRQVCHARADDAGGSLDEQPDVGRLHSPHVIGLIRGVELTNIVIPNNTGSTCTRPIERLLAVG